MKEKNPINKVLIEQWHTSLNGYHKPEDFSAGSHSEEIWWKCPKGKNHIWYADIRSRTKSLEKNNGKIKDCTACNIQKNNLTITNPGIAEQWHKPFNGDKKPEYFTSGQYEKIWWKCPKEKDHVWYSEIKSRSKFKKNIYEEKAGCPFCDGKKVTPSNSLAVKYNKIAKQWHKSLNNDKKPENFTPGSKEMIYWQCPKEKDHVWKALIKSRTNGDKCPYCSTRNTKIALSNCFATKYPALAKQWHKSLNNDKKPEDFLPGNHRDTIYWQCPKEKDHVWKALITTRIHGRGCPRCSPQSDEENKIFKEIKSIFKETENPYTITLDQYWTFDFFIPKLNLVIDYDGNYWHNKEEQNKRDKRKTRTFEKYGYDAFRIREQTKEHKLEKITPDDIIFYKENFSLREKDKKIKHIVDKVLENIINIYGKKKLNEYYPNDKIVETINQYIKPHLQNTG